ncbi:hypothetical protein BP5796_10624 [Coleophoma crateriformis]|uniref:UNC93-like protein n=1 Tax=Coleophoma crateriformis TaxID=565419 RepID=A0A3D8QQN9_9HELO|nr:hypothetical protein BP5796_10624 [Coleophoma crateriformis]
MGLSFLKTPKDVVLTSTALEAGKELDTSADEAATQIPGSVELPRSYHVCGLTFFAYTHPRIQTAMLGMVIFLTVGMYHVLSALGGAGQQTAYLADMASITLYAVFAAFALLAPAILSYFGIRITLFLGGLGYAAYAASLWCFNHTKNKPFVYFGGAWNGFSAALLWTAERTGITAYATEDKKGLYVAIFYTIYQIGTVVGSCIPVGQNWNAGTSSSTVTDGTYIGLMIMMMLGSCTALLLWPMHRVVREDGTRVALPSQLTFKEQVVTCWQILKANPWITLVWPYSFGYYYYNVYQNNRFNSLVFTVRGRSLNTLLSGIIQVLSGWTMALITDKLPTNRRNRAYAGIAFVFILCNAVWIGGYFAMVETVKGLKEAQKVDVFSPGYGVRAFLYVCYGYMDGCTGTYLLWFFGALSNDPKVLSVFISMFTFWSSAAYIIAYALDYYSISKEFMFGSSWFVQAIGPLFLIPIVMFWMKDTCIVDLDVVVEGQAPQQSSPEEICAMAKGDDK